MLTGYNTGTPTGETEEMVLGYRPAINADQISGNVPVRPAPGCGNQYWACGADNILSSIRYIAEGDSYTFRVPLDLSKTAHSFFAEPLGPWTDLGGFDPTESALEFQIDRSSNVKVEWDAASEIIETLGDSGQLTNWHIDDFTRWATARRHDGLTTEGEMDVTLTKSGSTYTVTLSLHGQTLASGSRGTANGLVVFSTGISGDVTIAYTADVTTGCVVVKRWAATYTVAFTATTPLDSLCTIVSNVATITTTDPHGCSVGDSAILVFEHPNEALSGTYTILSVSSTTTFTVSITHADIAGIGLTTARSTSAVFADPGIGEHFDLTMGPFTPDTYDVSITPTSNTGIDGTALTGTATVGVAAPGAPGLASYVSGDITNTVINFAASLTAGATYRVYDVQLLDGPTFLEAIVATHIAGTGTLQITIPDLSVGGLDVSLSGAINDTQTGIALTSLFTNFTTRYFYLDAEIVCVVANPIPFALVQILRGQLGTTAAAHVDATALIPYYAGERWIRLVSVNGGIEDGVQQKFLITYDASGNVLTGVPNVPTLARGDVTSGRTISLDYIYDATGENGTATGVVVRYENEAGTITTGSPTAFTGTDMIKTGTVSVTPAANGWYRFSAAGRTAAPVLSAYSDWSEWVFLSAGVPAAPTGFVATVVN